LGLVAGSWAKWMAPLTLPALALVMTLSATQVASHDLVPWSKLVRPTVLAILLNFGLASGLTLLLAHWLTPDPDLWVGFVLVAVSPPGVAILPFSYILGGDVALSLIGTAGGYLAALAIAPLMAFVLIGPSVIQPLSLLLILGESVALPLLFSRVLRRPTLAPHVDRVRGTLVNWGFFIVVFTVVALNRDVFFGEPRILLGTALIALLTTFGLQVVLELVLPRLGADRATSISLLLMGTLKNTGFAAATALTLFGSRAAVPGAVVTILNVVYLIALSLRYEGRH
jgi:bile acid:Na+ symporter, BASS family